MTGNEQLSKQKTLFEKGKTKERKSWKSAFFSHDTNLSVGVLVLFSQHLRLSHVSICEVEQGRIQVV